MGKQSSYPEQIDSDTELPRVDDNITEIGSDAINSIRDAIFSIEQAIGVNPQGNLRDFVTRINRVIDENGYIKTAALAERGLATLPLADIHVGNNAGIKEHKIDLDYSTSTLYTSITGNSVDIDSIRSSFNGFVSRSLAHFAGIGDRHDGYHITLINPIRSSDDLETALNHLNNAFSAHEASAGIVHTASSISVTDEFEFFSADTVQKALEELDQVGAGNVEQHQDMMHINSVSTNVGGVQNGLGNLGSAAFATTIFQTEVTKSTNIVQVLRPNSARITGGPIRFGSLSVGGSQILRIEAGGIGRSFIDVDLGAVIPTNDINEIVEAINQTAQGCTYHYPISAYNTGGRITIAHNIPGQEFTIKIIGTVTASASEALGFSDIENVEVEWPGETNAGYVGGRRIRDVKSLVKVHYVHDSKPLSRISPGLGDLSAYGISVGNEGRILCNITNHSANPDDNGTHYITSFPNDESFVLSADIQHGEFDLEIPADSLNFENSATGQVYDIFVENDGDAYGVLTKHQRVAYGTISGVDLIAVNNTFPISDLVWKISDSSQIQLFESNLGGTPVNIPTGYKGLLEVFMPDNVNSALFQVTGVPSNAARDFAVDTFSGGNDKFHVSSVHYSGNHGIYKLKYVVDKRQLGGTPERSSGDDLHRTIIEESLRDLRNNGIVRGLDVISNEVDSIYVRGGRALVNGKMVDVKTQTIGVNEFGAAKRALLLDKNGNFIVKSEFDAGYSFEELISGDAYGDNRNVVPLAEFETNGTEIDGYIYDRRFMVNNIDKRLLDTHTSLDYKITEIKNTVQGSMWGFAVASVSATDDAYLSSIEAGANNGFSYIPSEVGWWDQLPTDAHGFLGGRTAITTRRFEFSEPTAVASSIFRSPGLTHINVFVDVIYTGNNGGPFGVSSTAYIDIGVAIEVDARNNLVAEEYAAVKTLFAGVLPSNSVTEKYVISVPTSQLGLTDNMIFDIVPRVRVINANVIDGGTGDDSEPIMKFDNIRIVTSSYSIAGQTNEEDGSSQALAALVG